MDRISVSIFFMAYFTKFQAEENLDINVRMIDEGWIGNTLEETVVAYLTKNFPGENE
jgi:hypothetical protein